ncbi:response regulator transcription factor [Paenibacillus sp. sptzw28]|uniref:response regulator transcription factor n=1 Tax=Paenibacillus sp. sptzw28 TaxID=715179 RepID=UPI001C6EB3C9|nr:response regulator transcription factor [Paenibacillus sp. sptzw28]QYR19524.1 response regulator transcription factor [Paenibacillus sp. sptzw28]
MKKILVIEDEVNFARFIELELTHESYSVTVAYDGEKGLKLALSEEWDLILLDLMLPGLGGFDVCRRVREKKLTPIIMLTARDSVIDRVSGLDSGADDYIPKPFAIEELLARIRALQRRVDKYGDSQSLLTFRDISLNTDSRIVMKGELSISLTKREFDLLALFMSNINRVLTRDMLLDNVWGFDAEVEMNVVDVYVRYVRNKLGDSGEEGYIRTLRGIGYVMR